MITIKGHTYLFQWKIRQWYEIENDYHSRDCALMIYKLLSFEHPEIKWLLQKDKVLGVYKTTYKSDGVSPPHQTLEDRLSDNLKLIRDILKVKKIPQICELINHERLISITGFETTARIQNFRIVWEEIPRASYEIAFMGSWGFKDDLADQFSLRVTPDENIEAYMPVMVRAESPSILIEMIHASLETCRERVNKVTQALLEKGFFFKKISGEERI